MYHVAIVEDESSFAIQLQEYLKKYEEENDVRFKISVFGDGADILADYQPLYDIILLDIEMPKVNGMKAAEEIRTQDANVTLMFITNMANYAIRGYEVGALDFVMKPINYYTFSMKMNRVLKRTKQKAQQDILLTLPDGVKKLNVQQIYYVEVQNRMLYYHTDEGVFVMRGTMQSVEEMLAPYAFAKCNHWYIVNLKHVSEVRKNNAIVAGHELEVSRRNRTAFLKALTDYLGGAL
ncbi:MAG: response regulator transcription factor [Roseburia sp.]|nr:response regulator transcription factor [Roseburia sp.]